MPFFPNSSLYSKNYPRNINYMPPEIFSYASILKKIAILGQPPSVHPEMDFMDGSLWPLAVSS